jgi:hypothetical protein
LLPKVSSKWLSSNRNSSSSPPLVFINKILLKTHKTWCLLPKTTDWSHQLKNLKTRIKIKPGDGLSGHRWRKHADWRLSGAESDVFDRQKESWRKNRDKLRKREKKNEIVKRHKMKENIYRELQKQKIQLKLKINR